jgi:hypothetical protein
VLKFCLTIFSFIAAFSGAASKSLPKSNWQRASRTLKNTAVAKFLMPTLALSGVLQHLTCGAMPARKPWKIPKGNAGKNEQERRTRRVAPVLS